MKTIKYILSITLLITFFTACIEEDIYEEDIEINDPNNNDNPTGFDGSIEDIENFFNPSILNAMQDLGFVIYPGNTPPQIPDGTYIATPFILLNSTVPGDNNGSTFEDYIIDFFNHNNSQLTIDFLSENGGQTSNGNGSYISGYNNNFSVFLRANTTYQGYTAEFAYAISGKLVTNGIENFQFVNLMLDDNGDLGGFWIENNTGRLLYDSDGFTPLQGGGGSNGTGDAIFWIENDFSCGNININVDGVGSNVITGYYNSIPDCTSTNLGGNFNDLSPGNYNYTASCSNNNWSGSFTISENNCSRIKLEDNGGGGNGNGDVIFWINQDYGCGPISVSINGVGSTTISGYFPSGGAPDCSNTNAGGNINNIPEGTYSFSASCTGYSWDGTLTVTSNGCFRQQLSL